MTPDLTRCIFLDRDGVINIKLPQHQYLTTPDALTLAPGAASAIARLNAEGIRVVVVTNQRGIALGVFTEIQLAEVHQHLHALLLAEGAHLDATYHCPHAQDSCNCRKPLPGMFLQAFEEFPRVSAANSIMVGDSLCDIQAGQNLGMATVFIGCQRDTQDPGASEARAMATSTAESLAAFVEAFLPA